jgi:hypothetical protein
MFAIPGLVALLTFIYARPHEFVDVFRALPLLYVFSGLALFGMALDIRLGATRPKPSSQFFWALLFWAWCLLTAVVKAPTTLAQQALMIAIIAIIYVTLAYGVQTFRALGGVAAVLLGCVLFIAAIGVHQGVSSYECVAVDAARANELTAGKPDGRPCLNIEECTRDGEPGFDYRCERIGLVHTTSVGGGRVRYLGVLQDPNEMALAICCGLPFAFAFFMRRKSGPRLALVVVGVILVAVCTVMTQSRTGQLVFAAVLGTYFIKRFGWRGALLGVVAALPLLLLGGREGEEADSSSKERLECWYAGMTMLKTNPGLGVGVKQFTEHHYLTAHNSYVLAAAELGVTGLFLFSVVLYLSLKIPLRALGRFADVPEAAVARAWALALLAALSGMAIGIFFLSFCYHYVLWIYIGLTGAFYAAARAHDKDFRVSFGPRDAALVVAVDALLMVALFVYTRLKVG